MSGTLDPTHCAFGLTRSLTDQHIQLLVGFLLDSNRFQQLGTGSATALEQRLEQLLKTFNQTVVLGGVTFTPELVQSLNYRTLRALVLSYLEQQGLLSERLTGWREVRDEAGDAVRCPHFLHCRSAGRRVCLPEKFYSI